MAATVSRDELRNQIYNVAVGENTTLNNLYELIKLNVNEISKKHSLINSGKKIYCDFRSGDIRHSQADIKKIIEFLEYNNFISLAVGIKKTVKWNESASK